MIFRRAVVALITAAIAAASLEALEFPEVRVRLFADRSIPVVQLSSPSSLRIGSRLFEGPLFIKRKGGRLWVRTSSQSAWPAKHLFISSASREILLQAGLDKRRINGDIEIRPDHTQGLLVIGTMDEESYVLGIVEPELGNPEAPAESLKAQIVASRSYLLAMHARHASQGFDFCDTPHCQTFRGQDAITPVLLKAASSVRGKYLIYHHRPVPAFYHDNCGGMTAAADQVWPIAALPYLRPIHDESYCRTAPRSHWNFKVSDQTLKKCLAGRADLSEDAPVRRLIVVQRDSSGRVQALRLVASTDRRISAQTLRRALNRYFGSEVIPSLMFSVRKKGHQFDFEGRGWGHGVGLCQWGAMEMAREGRTYQEILQHYYPGTQLDQLTEPLLVAAPLSRRTL